MKDVLYGAIGIIAALAIFAGGVCLGAGMFPPGYQKEAAEEAEQTDTGSAVQVQETTVGQVAPLVTEPVTSEQPVTVTVPVFITTDTGEAPASAGSGADTQITQTLLPAAAQPETDAAALKDHITVDLASYAKDSGRDVIFLFTNDNDTAVRIACSITAKDDDDRVFAEESEIIRIIPAHTSLPRVVFFDGAKQSTVYDYTFAVTEPEIDDATDDLTSEVNAADGKVTVTYTNEGARDMTFCAAYVVFYNEGAPVFTDYAFVGTGPGNIAAGETFSAEIGADGHAFDSFSWYPVAGYAKD